MAAIERLICASDALVEAGDGVRFEIDGPRGPQPAFVVRFDGMARAYRNECAHVPMELDWNAGKFFDSDGRWLICSTHGAMYDPASGECRGGPCRGGRLAAVAVVERDGGIYLQEVATAGDARHGADAGRCRARPD